MPEEDFGTDQLIIPRYAFSLLVLGHSTAHLTL